MFPIASGSLAAAFWDVTKEAEGEDQVDRSFYSPSSPFNVLVKVYYGMAGGARARTVLLPTSTS